MVKNQSHTLAYSLVALQEMNLAYKEPLIYWNTACLITDTGGGEDIDGKGNNYDKLADGINKMRNEGVDVSLPDINRATYTFKPDEERSQIIFGLKGILGVGEEVIVDIMAKRPFKSLEDLMERTNYSRTVMVSLIKSGALDGFGERKDIMKKYLWETCDKKTRLNLQNMPSLMSYGLLPSEGDYREAKSIYEFNRYLKAKCKNGKLDERGINFLVNNGYDDCITSELTLNTNAWNRTYEICKDKYRDYITNNKDELLSSLNNTIFMADWNKYALGNYSSWEMETVCFYYHDHELKNVNKNKYGISNFFELPEDPVVDQIYNIKDKEVKIFKLNKICGTCLSKNKAKGTVKILTTDGVVEVRFNKEYFSMFDRTIKLPGADGKMHVAEESWFNRGSLILVQGIRQGDQFAAKNYKSTQGHRLYKISSVDSNGDLGLISERVQGVAEDE